MKKVIFLVLFLFAGKLADGQILIALLLGDTLNTGKIEFGLDGGLNLVTQDGVDRAGYLTTWNLGFYFDIKLKNPAWMIHTGVIVKSPMGADHLPVYSLDDSELDNEFSGGSVTRKLNYFNVPVMLKYRLKGHLYFEGGLQLGLLYKAVDIFNNTVPEGGDLSYKLDIEDRYHRLDAGAVVGIGYRLLRGNGMNLGLRYYFGFADVAKDDSTAGQRNQSIYLTVGIPIGGGKAKQ